MNKLELIKLLESGQGDPLQFLLLYKLEELSNKYPSIKKHQETIQRIINSRDPLDFNHWQDLSHTERLFMFVHPSIAAYFESADIETLLEACEIRIKTIGTRRHLPYTGGGPVCTIAYRGVSGVNEDEPLVSEVIVSLAGHQGEIPKNNGYVTVDITQHPEQPNCLFEVYANSIQKISGIRRGRYPHLRIAGIARGLYTKKPIINQLLLVCLRNNNRWITLNSEYITLITN